jgi:acyl carrier protein
LGTVIDSTGALELVTFLQEHFAIEVGDEDMVPENLDSVKSVVAYVAKKLAEKTNA